MSPLNCLMTPKKQQWTQMKMAFLQRDSVRMVTRPLQSRPTRKIQLTSRQTIRRILKTVVLSFLRVVKQRMVTETVTVTMALLSQTKKSQPTTSG